MFRFCPVGEDINFIGVDAQGLPVRRGRLLRVAHSYVSGAGTERSKNKSRQQHFSYQL